MLVLDGAGAAAAADFVLRLPLEQSPRPDRARLDPDDRNRLRLLDQERDGGGVAAYAPRPACLNAPPEGDERAFEGARQTLGQKERELVPVGVGERPDLELLREEVLLEPDGDASRPRGPTTSSG